MVAPLKLCINRVFIHLGQDVVASLLAAGCAPFTDKHVLNKFTAQGKVRVYVVLAAVYTSMLQTHQIDT